MCACVGMCVCKGEGVCIFTTTANLLPCLSLSDLMTPFAAVSI